MDILNVDLIKKLESNITRKLNRQDDVVDIRNFHGVFIQKDNRFIICKEVGVKEPCLREFFTGEIIEFSEVRFSTTVYSWRESGMHYSFLLNGLYFCLPLVNLLGMCYKDGKARKSDLSHLYSIVNEFLKDNPEFVNQLIENEKVR